MSEFTLQEKLGGAVARAREETTGKHFFDKAQPFFPLGFSVGYRNPGHWDVWAKTCPGMKEAWLAAHPGGEIIASGEEPRERAFRIRGEPGNVVVLDERWNPHRPHPRESMKFRSVLSAMLWIVEELMQEPSQPC
jgi:hypothetical protein